MTNDLIFTSMIFTVTRPDDKGPEVMAQTKYAEDAAALVALIGHGATIRINADKGNERIVWHEGYEAQAAEESYDFVATICEQRENNLK